MNIRTSFRLFCVTLAALSLSIRAAKPDSIGINLESNTAPIGASVSAGVLPAVNWNNVPYSGSAVSQPLNLASGAPSGLTLSIAAGYQFTNASGVNFAGSPGDTALMTGHVYNTFGHALDLTFSGASTSAQYDLYIYYNSSAVTNQQSFTVVGSGISANGYEVPGGDTNFVLSNNSLTFTGPGQANNANYVVLHGVVTGSNFTIEALGLGGVPGQTGGGPYAYINGLELVSVPEPSSICLLGLGVASALALHRRRRCA